MVGAFLASGLLISHYSNAAFSATTENTGNSIDTGTVVLVDDDDDQALYEIEGLTPNDTRDSCIEIDYQGTSPADVVMYGAGETDLDQYLDLTIEAGTLASFNDCATFLSDGVIYSGTLAGFLADHTGWADGAAVWSPAGGEQKSVKFSVTLQDDNAAQGLEATPTFTWESQNQTP